MRLRGFAAGLRGFDRGAHERRRREGAARKNDDAPPHVAGYALRMRRTGRLLGLPFDWRRPTVARAKARWWNPNDPRLFTPKVYGWGFTINVARLFGRKRAP